jgi:hypothetical protein
MVHEMKHFEAVLVLTHGIPRDVEQIIRSCPYCGDDDTRWDEGKGKWVCRSGN